MLAQSRCLKKNNPQPANKTSFDWFCLGVFFHKSELSSLCKVFFSFSRLCSGIVPGWWFQPIWKIWTSTWESSPGRGENKTSLKPPPRCTTSHPLNNLQCIKFLTTPLGSPQNPGWPLYNVDRGGRSTKTPEVKRLGNMNNWLHLRVVKQKRGYPPGN